jgi:hypothetical protein
MDVGNPQYWTTRVLELIKKAHGLNEGSTAYNLLIKQATSLLILTRACIDEKNKKPKKTRNNTTGQDKKPTQDS